MTEWYYLLGGEQQGPFSLEQLLDRLAALPPDTHVWHADLREWTPAHAVAQVAARLAPPPLAVPPPPPVLRQYPPAAAPSAVPFWQPVYANWLFRAAAMLVDQAIFFGALLIAGGIMSAPGMKDAQGEPTGVGLLVGIPLGLAALALGIWNRIFRDGTTGRSLGRQLTGTRLVSLATGQPIGLGMVLLRQVSHMLDNMPCICLPIGFLWPLWDEKRQTFADKIVGSIVIRERR